MYFEDPDQNSRILTLAKFFGNKFDCTSSLNIQDDYPWSIAGIWANSITIPTLGTNSTLSNLFTGKIGVGIYGYKNTNLEINNCRFERISFGESEFSPSSFMGQPLDKSIGYGVHISNGALFIKGLGSKDGDALTYDNCSGGFVHTEHSDVEIGYCRIRSVTEDNTSDDDTKTLKHTEKIIYSEANDRLQETKIYENSFKIFDLVTAIAVHKSDGKVREIKGNTFNFEAEKSAKLGSSGAQPKMIYFYNSNNGSFFDGTPAIISDNIINVVSHEIGIVGIHLNGSEGYYGFPPILTHLNLIENNKFNDFCGTIGIHLERASNNRVVNNQILGYTKGAISGSGIIVSGTTNTPAYNNTICSNTIDYVENGLNFLGNCDKNKVISNTINRVESNGLLLADYLDFYPPVIGLQFKNQGGDNYSFENSYDWKQQNNPVAPKQADAHFASSRPNANPKLSQFLIDKNNNYPLAPQIIKTSNNFTKNDWFVPEDNYNKWYIEECGSGNKPAEENSDWTALDESILQSEYGFHSKVTAWEAQRYIYRKLVQYPDLLNNEVRLAFYEQMQKSSVAAYESVQSQITHAFDIDKELGNELDRLETLRGAQIAKVAGIIKAFAVAEGDGEWDIIATQVIQQHGAPIKEYSEQIKEINAKIDAQRMVNLEKLNESIANLPTENEYEKGYQMVYSLWTKAALQNGYLDETDLAQIRIIAHECITRLGSSVLIARDLLPECEKYDDECPNGTEPNWIKAVKSNSNVTLFPNPADKSLTINIEQFTAVNYIEITTIEGRIVKNISTIKGENTYNFDVSDLNNGLYLVDIKTEKGRVLNSSKLIVQH